MNNTKKKWYLIWSPFFVMTILLVSLVFTKQKEFTMIRGEPLPDYEITLNVSNSPTQSAEYINAIHTVRYTSFNYQDAKASAGNHVEIGPSGYIGNEQTSPITSITGVTANFITDGIVTLWASYDSYNWFDYELISGTRLELPFLPYFVEFYPDGSNAVIFSSIIITYSCSPHEESMDKYRVNWLDDEGNLLESDYDVEPGTMPSYDGTVPTKDPYNDVYYTFAGWNPEIGMVVENISYSATFVEATMNFTLINDGTAYELTSVGDSTINSLNIPADNNGLPVTKIGYEALRDFRNLTSITLPTSIRIIDEGAFFGCTALESIEIPENVETMDNTAFTGCTALANINVNSNNLTFASIDGVLFNADFTELIYFPNNHGTTYSVPADVVTIGSFSFAGSTILTAISFPSSVTTILDNAFVACPLLNNVVIPNTITTLGVGLFVNCTSLENITLPSGLASLPSALFYGCTSLLTASLPSGILTIGNQAFSGCTSLATVTLPTSLTEIGSWAFMDCSKLETIVLPSGLLTIKSQAFTRCNSLDVVSIPSSVNSIGAYAFSECVSLTSINVDSANANYASVNGVLFNKDLSTLILYPTGKADNEYEIPATVTTIWENSFRQNIHITSVYVPATVTTILSHAFYSCTNLNIFCAVSGPLSGWVSTWNASNLPVTWNYTF